MTTNHASMSRLLRLDDVLPLTQLQNVYRRMQNGTTSRNRRESAFWERLMDHVFECLQSVHRPIVPWIQAWFATRRPINLFTRQPYHGINVILLYAYQMATQCHEPYYATFDQIRQEGKIKCGSRGIPLVRYIPMSCSVQHDPLPSFTRMSSSSFRYDTGNNNNNDINTQKVQFMRKTFHVYNVAQCAAARSKTLCNRLHRAQNGELGQLRVWTSNDWTFYTSNEPVSMCEEDDEEQQQQQQQQVSSFSKETRLSVTDSIHMTDVHSSSCPSHEQDLSTVQDDMDKRDSCVTNDNNIVSLFCDGLEFQGRQKLLECLQAWPEPRPRLVIVDAVQDLPSCHETPSSFSTLVPNMTKEQHAQRHQQVNKKSNYYDEAKDTIFVSCASQFQNKHECAWIWAYLMARSTVHAVRCARWTQQSTLDNNTSSLPFTTLPSDINRILPQSMATTSIDTQEWILVMEDCIAAMAASMVLYHLKMEKYACPRTLPADYIKLWTGFLKHQPKLLARCAHLADQAVDYMLHHKIPSQNYGHEQMHSLQDSFCDRVEEEYDDTLVRMCSIRTVLEKSKDDTTGSNDDTILTVHDNLSQQETQLDLNHDSNDEATAILSNETSVPRKKALFLKKRKRSSKSRSVDKLQPQSKRTRHVSVYDDEEEPSENGTCREDNALVASHETTNALDIDLNDSE